MFVQKGIDSIDASMIIKGFLQHSYFADRLILDDIGKLLDHNDLLSRFGLSGRAVTIFDAPYEIGDPHFYRWRHAERR